MVRGVMLTEGLHAGIPTVEHFSASSLRTYGECGMRYWYRYVRGERHPPTASLLRGTGVHGGAEADLRHHLDRGEHLAADQVVAAAVSIYDSRLDSEGIELVGDEVGVGRERVVDGGRDATARLARAWRDLLAPSIAPVEVEREFAIEVPINGQPPVRLTGRIDAIDRADVVRELKTRSRKPDVAALPRDLQLGLYDVAASALLRRPVRVTLDVVLDQVKPSAASVEVEISQADRIRLARRVAAAVGGIRAGRFPPADPGWWGCSERWCGYFRQCPYGGG